MARTPLVQELIPFIDFFRVALVVTAGHRIAFTELMKYGGLVSVIGGLLFLIVAWKSLRGRTGD